MAQNIVQRIFGSRKLPDNLSREEFDSYMGKNFPVWIKEFEDSGFLEATKLPPIVNEDEFIERVHQHRDELMVVKYWKHGCVPCLSFAEMYKAAQEACRRDGRRVVFYSVDTKAMPAAELVDYQMIEGTPTIQTFYRGRQVGDEIRATRLEDFMKAIIARAPVSAAPAPAS